MTHKHAEDAKMGITCWGVPLFLNKGRFKGFEMSDIGNEEIDGLLVVSPLSSIFGQQGVGCSWAPGPGSIVMDGMRA